MDRTKIPMEDYIAWLDSAREMDLLSTTEAYDELKRWVCGGKFSRGYALLDGFLCRWGQDHALLPEQIDDIRLDVLGPK